MYKLTIFKGMRLVVVLFALVLIVFQPVLVFADGNGDHGHDDGSQVVAMRVGDPVWWGLFLGSLVLIALLSLGVKKYLTVESGARGAKPETVSK